MLTCTTCVLLIFSPSVRTKTATPVDEEPSKPQKLLVLWQQLAAINAKLQRLEVGKLPSSRYRKRSGGRGRPRSTRPLCRRVTSRHRSVPRSLDRGLPSQTNPSIKRGTWRREELRAYRALFYLFSRFTWHESALSVATSSNGPPFYHESPHPRAQTPSLCPTFSSTQSRNSMQTLWTRQG